eukprot:scaffold59056_cov74-Phaeocystis_antarctica.AAC.8
MSSRGKLELRNYARMGGSSGHSSMIRQTPLGVCQLSARPHIEPECRAWVTTAATNARPSSWNSTTPPPRTYSAGRAPPRTGSPTSPAAGWRSDTR